MAVTLASGAFGVERLSGFVSWAGAGAVSGTSSSKAAGGLVASLGAGGATGGLVARAGVDSSREGADGGLRKSVSGVFISGGRGPGRTGAGAGFLTPAVCGVEG